MGRDRGPGAGRRTRRGSSALRGLLVCVTLVSVGVCGAGPAGAVTAAVGTFDRVAYYGSPAANRLNSPVVGMAPTRAGKGYWLVGADGGVFSYGDAGFYGSQAGKGVVTPFVGIARTPSGRGYWIAGDFGNVYNFGDAPSEDSVAGRLRAPVVGIASNPAATGYWLAAADGGVFSFGRAAFYGSMANVRLNAPIVGMAATPGGHGYWLVAADGGVFSFGRAAFYGSMANVRLNAPIVGMAATPGGHGYWLVAADGGVFSFGDAAFHGSMGNHPPAPRTPVVAMAAAPHGGGYWLVTTVKPLPPPAPVPSVLDRCNDPGSAPSVRPATIMLACGDGNAFLAHLVWASWTATGATGAGVFTHNQCVPNCALGTFVSVPARVELGYPVQTRVGKEFATISYSYANPSPPGGVLTFTVVAPTSPG